MAHEGIPYLELDATLDEWLPSVDLRRFRLLHVFNAVRSECRREVGWAPVRVQMLADVLGVHRRATGVALQALVERGTVLRDPPFPRHPGRRPAMFVPNFWYPDWRVPLRQPRELALRALGFRFGVEGWFVARTDGARLTGFDARTESARLNGSGERLSRAAISARLDDGCRAPMGRATNGKSRAPIGARLSERAAASHLFPVFSEEKTLSRGEGGDEDHSFQQLRRAVLDATGGNDVWGEPKQALLAVAARPDVASALRVIAYRPVDFQVPKLCKWLLDQAEMGWPALPSDDELLAKAEHHERMATTLEGAGDPDTAAWHAEQATALRSAVTPVRDTGAMEAIG